MIDQRLTAAWASQARLWAEGNKLWAEADELKAKSDKLMAEADKLWAEAGKLKAKSDKIWAEAVFSVMGNVTMQWTVRGMDYDCCVNGVLLFTAIGPETGR